MSNNTEEFNDGGVVTLKDEIIAYLNDVVEASPQVSYALPEDDKNGQRFEIMISDKRGVPKGAINLTVNNFDDKPLVALSAAGDIGEGSQVKPIQTLFYERVDQILVQVGRDSDLEPRYLSFVTAFSTYTADGFGKVEPAITDFLNRASDMIVKADHNRSPETVVKSSETEELQVQPLVLQEPATRPV